MITNIRVASPCSADWNKMPGDDRIRHCEACNLNVYNLSAFTEHEIRELLLKREGRLCGRVYQRSDGTVMAQNCPIGLRTITRRISRFGGVIFSLLASSFMAVPDFAQSYSSTNVSSAAVSIQVGDPNGARIADASATLRETSRNQEFKGKTDKKGELILRAPMGGKYLLTVSAPGLMSYTQTVELRQSKILSLPVKLDAPFMGQIVIIDPPTPPNNIPANTMPAMSSRPQPMRQ
jgi:hypothetical protein